jgi:hypothetical protein
MWPAQSLGSGQAFRLGLKSNIDRRHKFPSLGLILASASEFRRAVRNLAGHYRARSQTRSRPRSLDGY